MIGWLIGKLFGFWVRDVYVLDRSKPLLVVVSGNDEDARQFSLVISQYVDDVVVVKSDSLDIQLMRLG